eukprot:TRINITY_DN48561_c0_g1_i1.p2 TRINITY_DN48561_c0_g1~~TRINITY_DN48561_c0_g1_i1.p2  ORF type:complete len:162 (-),score=30.73 TRINITY_DN48561_c0_g1_i1:72-557(-)
MCCTEHGDCFRDESDLKREPSTFLPSRASLDELPFEEEFPVFVGPAVTSSRRRVLKPVRIPTSSQAGKSSPLRAMELPDLSSDLSSDMSDEESHDVKKQGMNIKEDDLHLLYGATDTLDEEDCIDVKVLLATTLSASKTRPWAQRQSRLAARAQQRSSQSH